MFSSYLKLAGDFICFQRVGLRWQESVDSFCALVDNSFQQNESQRFPFNLHIKTDFPELSLFHDSFKVKDPKTCYSVDKWTNSAKYKKKTQKQLI